MVSDFALAWEVILRGSRNYPLLLMHHSLNEIISGILGYLINPHNRPTLNVTYGIPLEWKQHNVYKLVLLHGNQYLGLLYASSPFHIPSLSVIRVWWWNCKKNIQLCIRHFFLWQCVEHINYGGKNFCFLKVNMMAVKRKFVDSPLECSRLVGWLFFTKAFTWTLIKADGEKYPMTRYCLSLIFH